MKTKMVMALIGLVSAVSISAQAAQITIGQPAYGGTGCPAGSASVTLSPGGDAMSILFDSYVAEAGGNRRVDRKSCNATVPVQVPQGYSIAVFQVDYRGFISTPSGGSARFDSEYFWAGSRGPRFSRTFGSNQNDNYTISDGLIAQTLVWTPCGASVNLRANTSMMAQSNYRGDQTMATVDSADISAGLIYHIQWRTCR